MLVYRETPLDIMLQIGLKLKKSIKFYEEIRAILLHMRSLVKIKPSRIGDIILSFTDIGKTCPDRDCLRL